MNGGTDTSTSTRYVVTEIEGYMDTVVGSKSVPGLSCHVIDTAWNRRVVATYRTEAYGRAPVAQEQKRREVRAMAQEHAARLNAA